MAETEESASGARHLTAKNFDEVLSASPGPMLVDFWAPWCGPCRLIAPMIDELARETEGRATVGKIDVQAEPSLAVRFSVMTLPSLVFFRDGKPVETIVGAVPKAELLKRLDALRS